MRALSRCAMVVVAQIDGLVETKHGSVDDILMSRRGALAPPRRQFVVPHSRSLSEPLSYPALGSPLGAACS